MSARDPLDDQHSAGAGGTTQLVGWFGAIGAGSCAEQLAAASEGSIPSSVCEQAEVADADQAFTAARRQCGVAIDASGDYTATGCVTTLAPPGTCTVNGDSGGILTDLGTLRTELSNAGRLPLERRRFLRHLFAP